MKIIVKKGKTSKFLNVFISDSSSTTGVGLTGLVYNTASLTAYYYREGAGTGATAISLVAATLGTWVSGGFVEIDATNMPGWYEFGAPDAVLATGVDSAGIHLKGATNMAPLPIEIQLDDNTAKDIYDIVNHASYGNAQLVRSTTPANTLDVEVGGCVGIDWGNVANPATAVDLSATDIQLCDTVTTNSDMRGTDGANTVVPDNASVAAILIDTSELQGDWKNGGRLDLILDTVAADVVNIDGAAMRGTDGANTVVPDNTSIAAILVDTDELQLNQGNWLTAINFSTHSAADIWSVATRLLTAGTNIVLAKGVGITGLNDLSSAQVNTEVDTALTDYDAPTNTEMASAFTEIKGATWSSATDTLEAIRDRGDAAWVTGTAAPTVAAIRAEMDTNSTKLTNLDATMSSRLAASDKTGFSLSAEGIDAIHDEVIEGAITWRQISRLQLSVLSGVSTGGGTGTSTFRDLANLKARVTATTDSSGNRTAVTLDAT